MSQSDKLQTGGEEFMENDECNNMTKTEYYDSDSVMCFMDVWNEKVGVCMGDIGGPVVNTRGGFIQVGIASWVFTNFEGRNCLVNEPQAASSIGFLYPWIQENM